MEIKGELAIEDENELYHFGCEHCELMLLGHEAERRVKTDDPYHEIHYFCKTCDDRLNEEEWL